MTQETQPQDASQQAELPGTAQAPELAAQAPELAAHSKAPKAPKAPKASKAAPKAPKAPKASKAPKGKRSPNEPMGERATHYTESDTRKYQANGPVEWSKAFREFSGRGGREGEGIRMALAFAATHSEQVMRWRDREEWRHAAKGGLGRHAAKGGLK